MQTMATIELSMRLSDCVRRQSLPQVYAYNAGQSETKLVPPKSEVWRNS